MNRYPIYRSTHPLTLRKLVRQDGTVYADDSNVSFHIRTRQSAAVLKNIALPKFRKSWCSRPTMKVVKKNPLARRAHKKVFALRKGLRSPFRLDKTVVIP